MSDVTVAQVTPAANAMERPVQSTRDTLASIAASVQAEEARRVAEANTQEPQVPAPAASAVQQGTPITQDPLAKKGIPAGLVDKDGQVSEDKILKANESLEKATKDKEARLEELLKRNKELRRKFGDVGQTVKQVEASQSPDEVYRKEMEQLEKNPVQYIRGSVQSEIQALRAEIQSMKAETVETGQARELDALVEQGHSWIQDEGLKRFEDVFQERPYLLQSRTPYRDAVRFMTDLPSNGAAAVPAQNGRSLPILGGGHAAPPPSQEPPASTEMRMEEMSKKLESALRHGDRAAASRLMRDMDKLERGY